jgi:hypothetical protein
MTHLMHILLYIYISYLYRDRIQFLLSQLSESLRLVEELKVAIKRKHHTFDSLLGNIQSEATSPQVVRFLLWITKNSERLAKVCTTNY